MHTWHHLPEISLRYSLTFSKLPRSAEEPSCRTCKTCSDPKPWDSGSHAPLQIQISKQLWRPSWPARLLPQEGFLPFFLYYGGKEVPFPVRCAPFTKQPSVPHILASSLMESNTLPSLPSLIVCRASCYCQSKTSSFFPLPRGLCMPSLVLPAFASPKRKKDWMQGPEFLHSGSEVVLVQGCWSRCLDVRKRTRASRWVPSPEALWIRPCLWHDLALPLAWLLPCFKGRIWGFAGTLKRSSSSKAQSFCHGASGQPERDAAVRLPEGCRCNLSPAHSGLVCGQTSARAARRWMASTHRNLLNQYVLCQLSRKGILEPKGNEQQPSCFLLAARQALRLCSHPQRLRAESGRCNLAENKSHFPHHGHRDPAEMLKFTWTPGGCRLQTPRCNLAGGSLHAGVRLAELPRQALHPHREAASHPGTDIFLPEGHSGCFWTAAGAAWGQIVAEMEVQQPDVIDSSQRAGSVICLLLFRSLGGVLSLAPHQQSTCQQVCAPTAWPLTSTHSSTN